MSRKYFIPANDDEYRKNYGIYADQITAPDSPYVTKYDLAAATVTQIGDDRSQLTVANALVNSLKAQLVKAEGDYETLKTGVSGRWKTVAGDIKRDTDFSEGDGEALKILGPENSDNWSDKTPQLRLKVVPEGVEIGFIKVGADGINLYCQRAGNGGLQFVRFISKSGWVDTRANHIAEQDESRQYSAFLVVNDHEVGQVSMPAPVSVRPRI